VVRGLGGDARRLNTDPTFHVRRFLNAALGMPITTKEREDDGAQGSVAFFFHENKTKKWRT